MQQPRKHNRHSTHPGPLERDWALPPLHFRQKAEMQGHENWMRKKPGQERSRAGVRVMFTSKQLAMTIIAPHLAQPGDSVVATSGRQRGGTSEQRRPTCRRQAQH
jgi:hypothetical protein